MDKVKVKWLKYTHPYNAGDIAMIPKHVAEYNANIGSCEIIGETKQNKMITSDKVETKSPKKVSRKKK